MAHFRYLAVNADREEVGGLIEAVDQPAAEGKIRQKGLVPVYLEKVDLESLMKKRRMPLGVIIAAIVVAVLLGFLLALARKFGAGT